MKSGIADNEITRFLLNVFLLEVAGKAATHAILLAFRFFGMPEPYLYYHQHPIISKLIFTLLLIAAIAYSTYHILKKRKK